MTTNSGKEIRDYMFKNGHIISIQIFNHNPFAGYTISGMVVIIRFKKGTTGNTVITRNYENKNYSFSEKMCDIIPLYFNNISASILKKVINKTNSNKVHIHRNRPRYTNPTQNKKYYSRTLVRFNKGKKFIYNYVENPIDYFGEKLVFSLMLNINTLLNDKKIYSEIINDTDCDKGMIYIKCNNIQYVKNYLESKLLYVCLLQVLDCVHLTKYNLGLIVPDIDTDDYKSYFGLTSEEINFIDNF